MNFLRHPLYTLFGLATCAWVSIANARGYSPMAALVPAAWFSASGYHSGMSHFGTGGFHHK